MLFISLIFGPIYK